MAILYMVNEEKSIKERDIIVPFLLFKRESDKILSNWVIGNLHDKNIGSVFYPQKLENKEHTNEQRF